MLFVWTRPFLTTPCCQLERFLRQTRLVRQGLLGWRFKFAVASLQQFVFNALFSGIIVGEIATVA